MFGWFNKKEEIKDEMIAENLFSDEDKNKVDTCKNCDLSYACKHKKEYTEVCDFAIDVSHIDFNKEIILLIDDNNGVVSFLEDDIEFYKDENIIPKDMQILSLTGSHAAFTLELLFKKIDNLKINYAIIDITLGGSRQSINGNIKYTGVDVFEMIYKHNNNVKYLFYTGNNLNPYIKSNDILINKYKKLTGKDIMDSVLYKTSIDMDSRRKYISDYLFNKE
jgi:hypothetical protein